MKKTLPPIFKNCFSCLLIASTLLLGGCSKPLAQIKMPVTLPDHFSMDGQAPITEKWWEQFEDAKLNALIEEALTDNLDLLMTWDRLALAQAQMRKSGADLLPSVDMNTSTGRKINRNNGNRNTTGDYSYGMGASYEIDLWGKIRSNQQAAIYNQIASRHDVHAAAMTLSASIAQTWYQLIEQQGQIQLLDEQIKLNKQVLEIVDLRFRQGQTAASDVLRQKSLVESRNGDRILALSEAKVLKHQLAVLLGKLPNSFEINAPISLIKLPMLPATGLPLDVIQRRPDVLSAYQNILAADRDLAQAIADQYPTVSLSLNVGTSSEKIRDLFDNWFANLAANVVGPIFDGGQRKAEVSRQKALVSEALHNYHNAILTAINDVEDSLVQELHQVQYIESLQKQLKLNRDAVNRIRDQYIKGGQDYLNVIDSLLDMQGSERDLLSAQEKQIEYRITLCRSLSGSWQMKQPDILQASNSDKLQRVQSNRVE